MSQARRGRGERAPSPYSRGSSSSYRSRSPQAARSVDPHGSMSVSAVGTNQDVVSELWHEKLKNRRREPSEERSSRLVDQFSSELSKEAPWVTNLGRYNNNDSDLLRSAKQRILTLTRQWHGAEKDALSAVDAVGRDVEDTKAAIADLSGRIAEKEQTMNAVTGMTAMLREKLADMEKEAYLRGIDWQRPPPPRNMLQGSVNGVEMRQNVDVDTFSVSSEPVKGLSSTPNRDLAWASSPIQRTGPQRPLSGTTRQPSPSPATTRGRSASPAARHASPQPSRAQSPSRADAVKGAAHARPWRGGGIAIVNTSNTPARSRSPAPARTGGCREDATRRIPEPNNDVAFSESLNSPYADDHQAYFQKKNIDAADEFQRIRREQVQRRQSMIQQPVLPSQPAALSPRASHGAVAADSPGPYVNRWADESADDMFGRTAAPVQTTQVGSKEQLFVRQHSGSRQYENDDLQKLADECNNDVAQRNRIPSLDFATPVSQPWGRGKDVLDSHFNTAPRTTLSIPLSMAGGDSNRYHM